MPSVFQLSSRAFGFSVCSVMEAFNSKFVCNLHAEDLCYLATISGFLFGQKLFIALAKSTKCPARIHMQSLLRCTSSWKIKSLEILSFEIK